MDKVRVKMDTTVWRESMVYKSLDSVGYDCGM